MPKKSILAALAIMTAILRAQTAAAHPDLSGIWDPFRAGRGAEAQYAPPPPGPIVLKPGYAEAYAAKRRAEAEANKRGEQLASASAQCVPYGMPNMMSVAIYPMEVIQTPAQVTIVAEAFSEVRRVYIDKPQAKLEDVGPGFYGRSVGKWEGDTLVVDTIGIKPSVGGFQGMPHSPQMRITERIRRVAPDFLQDQVRIDDPVTLEKPVTYTLAYKRLKDYEMVEFVCENNREYVDEKGVVRPEAPRKVNQSRDRDGAAGTYNMKNTNSAAAWIVVGAAALASGAFAQASRPPVPEPPPPQMSALAPANLAKPRPQPPFDITGTWQHDLGPSNPFRFSPPPGFKLTPAAQVQYDAAKKAAAAGKVYHDDIGQCWPAGLPVIMTRVWPIAMVQKPTAIYMISGFMNSVRIVYLDGRPHTDPDLVIRSFNGESIGRWEGDALVVDTTSFVDDHHWIDDGIPASDALHIVERVRLIENGARLAIEYTLTDPKSWEGDWKMTKYFKRVNDTDITEASCLPDLNAHMPSTSSQVNVR